MVFEERQEGDYKDFVKFDSDIVESWLKSTKDFIKEIEMITINIIEKSND